MSLDFLRHYLFLNASVWLSIVSFCFACVYPGMEKSVAFR